MSAPSSPLGETASAARSLDDWLAYIERLHPKTIELGLQRLAAVAQRMGLSLSSVVITVGGTNGKGSTCAMLEAILLQAGYHVGLYTSPHLLHFNERVRIDGQSATDAALAEQFAAVEAARGDTALTYFEFSTLAALRLFQHAPLDVVILEVGLGGRLDAVNLIDADCAIVTSIDVDHAEFLGADRNKIGWEKAHIFRTGRPAICSDPMPPPLLVDYAREIDADLWLFGRDFNYSGDRQQWSYGGRGQRRNSLAYPALRGANQLLNASGVLAALEALRTRLPVTQQAVRQGLAVVELPGRFQVLAGRPAVVLDVAHNPHAAAHLAQNLDNMGFYPDTYAVLGIMRDKDVDAVIAALKSRVQYWLPTDLPGARAASAQWVIERLLAAGVAPAAILGAEAGDAAEGFRSPSQALAAARLRADENDRIVVFGSFLTVADILASRESTSVSRS
ncbi:MAG: bifunctional tetrahydrofolate synthase/dihydrofolate synthase [Burkholderiales bacterium]|nr:bifunctional tetrahydrofolate synthase/dihydrofolate synthase [Burkholderiales bacterium]